MCASLSWFIFKGFKPTDILARPPNAPCIQKDGLDETNF